ncbi:Asp-tRNA(Asn)/Glu-tRNA(Gln) amidotransferase subunit GatA [Hydrogenobaculum acidophilum]
MLYKESVSKLLEERVKPSEIVEAFLKRKEELEPKIRAYVTEVYDKAYESAKALDSQIPKGKLFGIPIAIKDNINIEGYTTTCSSKMLQNYVSVYDATVIKKLKQEGAIIVGKTNMDEFAMGSSTEYSAFFQTKNPWNLDFVPGGSSGGSAASVGANMAPLALGSDTGGSIRQPASFCGVIGLKPTYGRVSRYGLVAFASSLDQIGPFGRYTKDVALLLEVISGHDPKDSTSANIEVPSFSKNLKPRTDLKIGIPKEFMGYKIDKEVEESFKNFVKFLEDNKAIVKEISLPHIEYAIPVYYIIAPAEASSNLARFDGVRYGYRTKDFRDIFELYAKTRDEGFGPEVKRRIMLGTYVLSSGYYEAYYGKALAVKNLIKKEFLDALKDVDVIISPTSPTPPFRFGEKLNDPIAMYLSDIFTVSVNLAELPAISIPSGFTKDGLPIGVQIIGRAFDEQTLLDLSYAWELNYPHYDYISNV